MPSSRSIASLPSDALRKIFQFAVVYAESASPREAPINLTHTCHSWRALALSSNCSKLWTQFRTGKFQPVHVELALLWLSRAGKATLSFQVLALRPEHDVRIATFFRLLIHKQSQWGEMSINFDIGNGRDYVGTKLVNLTHSKFLEFTWSSVLFRVCLQNPEQDFEFPNVASVPLFSLDAQGITPKPIAPNLQKLVFRGKIIGPEMLEGFQIMLQNCPVLEDLSLSITRSTYNLISFPEVKRIYTLPRLHTLKLEGTVGLILFLESLVAPALHTLKVATDVGVGNNVAALNWRLAKFIVNSGHGAPIDVVHLLFSEVNSADDNARRETQRDLLRALPHVTDLALHVERAGYTVALLFDEKDRVCPLLETLYLDISKNFYNIPQLHALLISRFEHSATFRATIRIADWGDEEQDNFLAAGKEDYIIRYIVEGRLSIIRSSYIRWFSEWWCWRGQFEYVVTVGTETTASGQPGWIFV